MGLVGYRSLNPYNQAYHPSLWMLWEADNAICKAGLCKQHPDDIFFLFRIENHPGETDYPDGHFVRRKKDYLVQIFNTDFNWSSNPKNIAIAPGTGMGQRYLEPGEVAKYFPLADKHEAGWGEAQRVRHICDRPTKRRSFGG